MCELLSRFRSEHDELQEALAGILPRQFRTGEGSERINRVRILLHEHVLAENEQLYPTLRQAAVQNDELGEKLQRMDHDLKIVTDLAEDFCRKYQDGAPQLIEFATDHGALLTILRIRLRREEEMLFPLYDQLSS